jgi:hypothetical protein
LVYAILKNLILVPNFIFFIFQLFFGGRRERESLNSDVEREKIIVDEDSSHQNSQFLCQMVSCDEESSNWFFVFTLKVSRKKNELEKILDFVLILGFWSFFLHI